ncbi:branched-chain amino acid aminotransferase [Kineosporia sp. J2-2]|uniref:Branched-chain-amino-acid aminotransferase n=1 Tax=Kineosporia corallincola TaxID=2835133 RepID=A0ABS5TH82_9ACTN|nr:branched-chain amino acid aminotransferase [Kineosporia corallincola]MBT0769754.1 branched-chain amino acid aminotransferase [Kineosporia corallincola]
MNARILGTTETLDTSDVVDPSETTSRPLTFSVTPNPAPATPERRAQIHAQPGFGKFFTDHMVSIDWTQGEGWHDAGLIPYGPIQLDPAAAVLHYAQEIFEGLKAYRHADGSVWAFRPEANAARLARSARRLALPELSEEDFLASIDLLVKTDQAWVPDHASGESSLYLRPFMYASETFLGVRPSKTVRYLLIASPVGPYFSGGVKPVSIWLSSTYTRAAAGGTGAAKCGGNYAAGLAAQLEAEAHGCEQVCFLDAAEHRWVEELGGMNIYFVKRDGTLVTPTVSGTILEGITRSSILTLAGEMGLKVEERQISIDEWRDGVASGEISEVFACGTAAVITPLGKLAWEGGELEIPSGEVAMKIRQSLLDVQYGRAEDTHGWMRKLA